MDVFKNELNKVGKEIATTTMSGVGKVTVAAPREYGGDGNSLNPEELFVASVNSCLMLVFDHFANKYKVDLISYDSQASGEVEKTKNGLRFTKIAVAAQVKVDDAHADKIGEITELAEKFCLVSGSLNCPVTYEVKRIS